MVIRDLAVVRSMGRVTCTGWPRWCLVGWLLLGLASRAAAQAPPARVVVAAVQQRQLATGQTFVGTVVPLRTSTVGSQVEGLVDKLLVNEGDEVRQGDPLAELDTEQLGFQLAAAKAELETRVKEFEELKVVLPEQIEQAYARMEAAEALMKFAGLRLKRTQSLFARNSISEDELQERESIAVAARQKYREDKAAWQALNDSCDEKIAQGEARVQAQQAEVSRLEVDVRQHTITAPFDGYVTKEHTEKGEWITKGAPVVEVVELKEVEVSVPVPESYFSQVHPEMKAGVTIGALPGRSWQAPVKVIVPQADARSRSFPIKVRLANPTGPGGVLLKPGMFARVTLPIGTKQKVLLVPKDAVVLGGRSPVVYAVDPIREGPGSTDSASRGPGPAAPRPEGMARLVPVELGAPADGWVEVRGPAIEAGKALKPGDRVVVEGNERLFPGRPLIIVNLDRPSTKPAAAQPRK